MSEQKMREALGFYADPVRYHGANQRNETDQKWSGDAPYILDVTRDGGRIAREALAQQPVEAVELTDEEIDFAVGWSVSRPFREAIRKVIAAHEAKKAGGWKWMACQCFSDDQKRLCANKTKCSECVASGGSA